MAGGSRRDTGGKAGTQAAAEAPSPAAAGADQAFACSYGRYSTRNCRQSRDDQTRALSHSGPSLSRGLRPTMTGVVKVVTHDRRTRKEIGITAEFFMIPKDLIPQMGTNSFAIMKARR